MDEEVSKLVDGAYKNILEKFNPSARQLVSAGKAYLKALHGTVTASKAYMDALSKLARHAHQGTWGGCADIGTALMQLVDVQKELEAQQMNILKAFYVDLLVPLESNIDKDTKVVATEQRKFIQQHKCLQESYMKAAATVKKQRKKSRNSRTTNIDKEIKNVQALEEEKMKLDCFCERSLKQAIIQERRRYGFVLERQCSLTKHNLVYYSQGQSLLQHRLDEWEDVAKGRESLPDPIDKLFPPSNEFRCTKSRVHPWDVPSLPYFSQNAWDSINPDQGLPIQACSEYASSNIILGDSNLCLPSGGGTLRKTRSIDASCLDLRGAPLEPPFHSTLTRAKSDFNIASSSASLASDDYGSHLRINSHRTKSLMDGENGASRVKVRALYSYLSSGEHQLSFHEGDIIALVGSRNKGWQYGENQRNHRCGWFPIAYTEPISDDVGIECDIEKCLDSDCCSSQQFKKPAVTRSKTTPDIHPYECGPDSSGSAGYSSSASSPLSSECAAVPPVPKASQRPFSTFVDAPRNFESLQHLGPKLLHTAPRSCSNCCASSSAPTAAPASPTNAPLTSDSRRAAPSSLHGSNDSGFCNDGSSGSATSKNQTCNHGDMMFEEEQYDGVEPLKTKENMFSSVKLRKVVTNDRSAPMIS